MTGRFPAVNWPPTSAPVWPKSALAIRIDGAMRDLAATIDRDARRHASSTSRD